MSNLGLLTTEPVGVGCLVDREAKVTQERRGLGTAGVEFVFSHWADVIWKFALCVARVGCLEAGINETLEKSRYGQLLVSTTPNFLVSKSLSLYNLQILGLR